MTWIKTINYVEAEKELKRIYDRVKGPDDNIDNVLTIHSLRPHTLKGHMSLYKSVLHHSANTLPKWYLETLGVYVSHLNKCDYCVDHHLVGVTRLRPDINADELLEILRNESMEKIFNTGEIAGLMYAKVLTLSASKVTASDMERLREAGLEDGEILEINQVISYFNYVNRTVLGLGVNTSGDVLGLSPGNSSSPDDWSHN